MKLLRCLRIITFWGFLLVVGLVLWQNIAFIYLLEQALIFDNIHRCAIGIVLVMFFLYPVFFLVTVAALKAQGRRVYLIYGKNELSLWGLFMQNEFWPVFRYLEDYARFPYWNVYKNKKLIIRAHLYRAFRCISIVTPVIVAYYCSLKWLSII